MRVTFVSRSVLVHIMEIYSNTSCFALGLLACAAISLLVTDYEEMFGNCMDFLTK